MKKSCLLAAACDCVCLISMAGAPAFGSTTYDITTIGLTDAEHTRSTGNYRESHAQYLNEAGQALGYASRFNGITYTGRSAWLYDGMTTLNIGLTDAGHTNSSTGYQGNEAMRLNEAGQALGTASRFNGATSTGSSAWLYNGTTTQEIGLTDAGHTNSSTGYQSNNADYLNEAGQVLGHASRFNGATSTGRSAWLYNGTTTQEIGLTDAGHTNSSTGYQYNEADLLNEAGQAVGTANRYNGATSTGQSAWLYNGTTTQEVGLTDAGHTNSSTGYQYNEADLLNEAGQAVGFAERYNGATYTGQSAWFYDATIDQTYSMDLSINPTDGYASSNFFYLGNDGLGLGSYSLFDTGGALLGTRAFSFTVEDGFLDLGSLVADLSGKGWLYLAYAIRANGAGQIIGSGLLDDMTSGSVAYLLTPPDTDSDGVPDGSDNCTDVANVDQLDTDGDDYGNLCDGDLNNDGSTNTLDLNLYKLAHRSALGDANYDVDADFNGDGVINTLDLNIYKGLHRKPPGPSCCAP